MHERRGVLAVNGNPADLGQRRFSDVSALMPRTPGVYDAEVDLNWAVGGKPNGGYLLAMLGRSAGEVGNHSDVLAASAHYLRAPEPGPVLVEAELLRAGRSASQIRARLTQGNRSFVEALIVTGDLDPDSLPYWEAGLPQFDGPAYEDCERLIPGLPDGTRVALMEQIESISSHRGSSATLPLGRASCGVGSPCLEKNHSIPSPFSSPSTRFLQPLSMSRRPGGFPLSSSPSMSGRRPRRVRSACCSVHSSSTDSGWTRRASYGTARADWWHRTRSSQRSGSD